jgi:hypothetical protein
LDNTDKEDGNPDLAGKVVKGKKDTGVQTKAAAAEKPDKNGKKKNYEGGSKEWQPETAVVDIPDFGD